ncbi:DNA methyltransferase [Rudanella lutea]|uniref:DNA methyltransferase n=1 Tax=Rudanella lutea TaxID=451374 RepID=UPI000A029F40|nr:DNA methyltransferase [Rudanella lutea]
MRWSDLQNSWVINEQVTESEIPIYPINSSGNQKVWQYGVDRVRADLTEFKVKLQGDSYEVYKKKRINLSGILPRTWWDNPLYSARDNGTAAITDIFGDKQAFSFPKSVHAVSDSLKVSGVGKESIILDYFAGSGTTGHAVINLNREDEGKRKYILVEMGEYFDTVTKPRIQKVIYSKDWRDGKPLGRQGISHCFKYLRLESYEDTLNNLSLARTAQQELALGGSAQFREGYLLRYMLDVESRASLFDVARFRNPFACYIDVTRQNERTPTRVDLVETFNYLIGLVVEGQYISGKHIRVVTGQTLKGEKTLIIWRNQDEVDNAALNEWLQKSGYNPRDREFDRIYVNGDNHLENLRRDDETWKVTLIEEEFSKRMG